MTKSAYFNMCFACLVSGIMINSAIALLRGVRLPALGLGFVIGIACSLLLQHALLQGVTRTLQDGDIVYQDSPVRFASHLVLVLIGYLVCLFAPWAIG